MTVPHPQETVLQTYSYNGIPVDLVQWTDTVWCGKIGWARDNTDEPDVDKIAAGMMAVMSVPPSGGRAEPEWEICLSANYLSDTRPNGVMFAYLVTEETQPDCFDVYKLPAAQYLRIRMNAETAAALGHEPWPGGIPPYGWIGEEVAPALGYAYGSDMLPVIEYYGNWQPQKNAHEFCYLYVPVQKAG